MQNHKRFYVSLRASVTSVAINEQRIPKRNPNTVDCFARNDNRNIKGIATSYRPC
ncbi:MAG: hypothetical protein K2N54_06435 [Helicobacter sp.]|nr:hypothetical protein [Helicobacter sp.]